MYADVERSDILENAFFASEWEVIASKLEAGILKEPRRDLLLDLFGAVGRGDTEFDIEVIRRIIVAYLDHGFTVSIDAFIAGCEQLQTRDELAAMLGSKLENIDSRHPVTGIHPLVYAASLRLPKTVKILLSKLADPNAYDAHGRTPLLAAVFHRGIVVKYDDALRETVRLLFQFGADPHMPLLQSHHGVPVGTTVDVVGVSYQV